MFGQAVRVAIDDLVDMIETFNKKKSFVQLCSSWMFAKRLAEAESAVEKARDDLSVSARFWSGARTCGYPTAGKAKPTVHQWGHAFDFFSYSRRRVRLALS